MEVDSVEMDLLVQDLSKMECTKKEDERSYSKRRCKGLVRCKNSIQLKSLEGPMAGSSKAMKRFSMPYY